MKLLELRQKTNTSQQKLSKELNITQEKYSRLENGISKMNSEILIKIADFYNVSIDYLLDRPFNNNIGFIPEERKETIKTLLELSNNEFKEVAAFVRGFKSGKEKTEDFEIFKRR